MDSMIWEMRLQAGLAAAGLPVATPMPTGDGSLAHAAEDGSWWTAMEYRPGEKGTGPAHLLAMMDMLVELHDTSRRLISELGPRPLLGESFAMAQWLHQSDHLAGLTVAQLMERLRQTPMDTSPGIAATWQRLDQVVHVLTILDTAALDPDLARIPRVAIHADYWTFNLSFTGETLTAIYDFDDSHADLPIHDVMQALSRCCRLPTGGIDWTLASRLSERYQRRRPLCNAECRHAAASIIAKECWYLLPGLAMQLEDPVTDRSSHTLGWRLHDSLWHLTQHMHWSAVLSGKTPCAVT